VSTGELRELPTDRRGMVYGTLIAAYICLILLTNTVGTKLFNIELPLVGVQTFPVSVLCFPFTFLVTDIVSDIFGPKQARYFVVLGFLASLVLVGFVLIGLAVSPAPTYVLSEAYNQIFGPTWRLFFASMTAYLLAQTIDVSIFHWIKSKTGNDKLWLRNNVSTMFSQLVDTFTVFFVFLYKNPEVFSGGVIDILKLVLSVYVAKILIAAIDTPFCYAGVWWVRKYLSEESKDRSLA
jgi:queuosine precursor transporter